MVVRHNCRPLRSGSWANSQSRPHRGNQILDRVLRAKNGSRA